MTMHSHQCQIAQLAHTSCVLYSDDMEPLAVLRTTAHFGVILRAAHRFDIIVFSRRIYGEDVRQKITVDVHIVSIGGKAATLFTTRSVELGRLLDGVLVDPSEGNVELAARDSVQA